MSDPDTAIRVEALSKEFRSWRRRVQALDTVSFTVRRGEVFGLLGANGAGKTTLVKILLGLTRPSSGRVLLKGMDPRRPRARRRVGYLPEGHRFPGYLSGEAALRLFGRLAGLDTSTITSRSRELLDLVGLAQRGSDRLSRYSKGMTQRLGLAAALLDDPEVLLLDEPTDGVDPVGRRHIRDVLLQAKERGTTILINSHLLSEVERTCDRVAILNGGRLLREASVEEATRETHRFRIRLGEGQHAPASLLDLFHAAAPNGHIEIEVPDLGRLNLLLDELRRERLQIAEVTPQRAALEDVFIELVREEECLMKVWALVADTWREALARYTLLGFLIVSSLLLMVLTFALNLDIVNGSLAAGSLFGKAFDIPGGTPIDTVVTTAESAFAAALYGLGIFLAVFATGSQVPSLVHRGTVDLYLSRPVGRTTLLLGRFAGAVTLVLANLAFLCGGVFLVISLKTGVWNPRFLLAGGVIAAVFLSYLGFMYLIGVLSGSTPLSIMLPYAIYILAMPLAAHKHIAAAMDSRLAASAVHGLYWLLPKSAELGRDVVELVMGKGELSMVALGTTMAFGAGCLLLATVLFHRKSY